MPPRRCRAGPGRRHLRAACGQICTPRLPCLGTEGPHRGSPSDVARPATTTRGSASRHGVATPFDQWRTFRLAGFDASRRGTAECGPNQLTPPEVAERQPRRASRLRRTRASARAFSSCHSVFQFHVKPGRAALRPPGGVRLPHATAGAENCVHLVRNRALLARQTLRPFSQRPERTRSSDRHVASALVPRETAPQLRASGCTAGLSRRAAPGCRHRHEGGVRRLSRTFRCRPVASMRRSQLPPTIEDGHGTARHGTARHGTARHGTAPTRVSSRPIARTLRTHPSTTASRIGRPATVTGCWLQVSGRNSARALWFADGSPGRESSDPHPCFT